MVSYAKSGAAEPRVRPMNEAPAPSHRPPPPPAMIEGDEEGVVRRNSLGPVEVQRDAAGRVTGGGVGHRQSSDGLA